MNLIKCVALCTLLAGCLSPVTSTASEGNLNEYFSGAMKVYTAFIPPSEEESKKFTKFVLDKWKESECVNTCSIEGFKAAKEYAKNIKVDLNNGL